MLFAFLTVRSMWLFHDRLLDKSATPMYLAVLTASRSCVVPLLG